MSGQIGEQGESFVAQMLCREGWSILARNWRGAGGEIDLVVERCGVLRFVEVKARSAPDSEGTSLDPDGIESINHNKRRRLTAAANAWLDTHALPVQEAAFLVALVSTTSIGLAVQWWDDAF